MCLAVKFSSVMKAALERKSIWHPTTKILTIRETTNIEGGDSSVGPVLAC